jgi:hypothetical protein
MQNRIRKVLGFVAAIFLISLVSCKQKESGSKALNTENTFTTDQLKDKIKGGWAGQTIGVMPLMRLA